jgi:hypothetical protein
MNDDTARYASHLVDDYKRLSSSTPEARLKRTFLGGEMNLLGESSLPLQVRRSMLESYRLVETELFGAVTELPGETELLQLPLPSTESLQPEKSHIRTLETMEDFPKDSGGVFLRRFVVFLLGLVLAYFFMWLPWRSSRADFLFFVGCGMIQLAAVYMAWDAPPLFMNPFMSLCVSLLSLAGFVLELIVGFGAKPWWEALLLPIPPLMFAVPHLKFAESQSAYSHPWVHCLRCWGFLGRTKGTWFELG